MSSVESFEIEAPFEGGGGRRCNSSDFLCLASNPPAANQVTFLKFFKDTPDFSLSKSTWPEENLPTTFLSTLERGIFSSLNPKMCRFKLGNDPMSCDFFAALTVPDYSPVTTWSTQFIDPYQGNGFFLGSAIPLKRFFDEDPEPPVGIPKCFGPEVEQSLRSLAKGLVKALHNARAYPEDRSYHLEIAKNLLKDFEKILGDHQDLSKSASQEDKVAIRDTLLAMNLYLSEAQKPPPRIVIRNIKLWKSKEPSQKRP
jgi:hypothetical protein